MPVKRRTLPPMLMQKMSGSRPHCPRTLRHPPGHPPTRSGCDVSPRCSPHLPLSPAGHGLSGSPASLAQMLPKLEGLGRPAGAPPGFRARWTHGSPVGVGSGSGLRWRQAPHH